MSHPLARWLRTRRQRRDLDEVSSRLTQALLDEDWPAAIAAGTQAVDQATRLHGEQTPGTVAPRYALAAAYLGAGQLDDAEREAELVVQAARAHPVGLEPPLPVLYELRLAIAERRGDDDAAGQLLDTLARAYDRMRAADPEAHASVLHRKALHLARSGELAAASPLFSRALTLLSQAPEAALNPAEVLYNRASLAPEQTPAAPRLADFERALQLSPPALLRARIEHNRATVLESSEEPDAALTAYRRALDAWPSPEQARPTLVRLARLHHSQRRYDEAVPLYQRARKLAVAAGAQDVVARIDTWIGDAHSHTYR